jgi:nitrogenase molybdenum-iron protein beta chain
MEKLLKHTTGEIKERTALTINPAKTCQPIGAMYAALGVHGCLPHSHGSQGCCSYHRSMLTRHYKEPVMAATSSFTEGASVFGGQANLVQAINNIFSIYNPDAIAVHTTCLSETIGDDIPQIVAKAQADGKVPEGKFIFHASTPSYVGSHVTGFANMVKGMVDAFPQSTGHTEDMVNIIPGYVEPSDMAEIKRLSKEMGVKTIMYPDTSDVLNTPMTGNFEMYPAGGTPIDDIIESGDAKATLALGEFASAPAAKALDVKCKVPCEILDLPIGFKATDRFIQALADAAGVTVPDSITKERGQMMDFITDMHQYFHGKRVALAGDPDQMVAMTEFLLSIDMKPVYVITGTPGKKFGKRMEELTKDLPYEVKYKAHSDLFLLHQWIKQEGVDLLIGGTHMKYIAHDEEIPLIRFGFPIIDRVGHQYFPTVGYMGGIRLLEKMLDAILDYKEKHAPVEKFELVL